MKGIQSNGFLPIIAQAIAEMEETHGEFLSIDKINLGELGRRTGLSRAKLRRLKATGFCETPHGLADEIRNDTDHMIDASVRYLGHTRAPLVLLPLEDALGIEEQANLPGTLDTHPNWRRRLPGEAASLLDNDSAARRLELLAVARNQAYERDR